MKPRSLALSLSRLRRLGDGGDPTVAQAAAALRPLGRLALLPFLAALGMAPSPGLPLGAICGGLIVWLALMGLLGRPFGAPPARLGRRRLPAALLTAALRRVVMPLRRLEKLARPRLSGLTLPTRTWLAMLGQGMVMALPIPFGNLLPGVAVIVLAVALLRHDGIAALIGHVLALVSLAVLAGLGWGLTTLW